MRERALLVDASPVCGCPTRDIGILWWPGRGGGGDGDLGREVGVARPLQVPIVGFEEVDEMLVRRVRACAGEMMGLVRGLIMSRL